MVVQRFSAVASQRDVTWRLRVPAVFIWFPLRAPVSSHSPQTAGSRLIFQDSKIPKGVRRFFVCSLMDWSSNRGVSLPVTQCFMEQAHSFLMTLKKIYNV